MYIFMHPQKLAMENVQISAEQGDYIKKVRRES